MPRKSRRLIRKSKRNLKKSRRTQSKKTMMGGSLRDELIMGEILLSYLHSGKGENGEITHEVLKRVADPYKIRELSQDEKDDKFRSKTAAEAKLFFTSVDEPEINKNKEAFNKIKEKWEAYKKTLVESKSWLFGTKYSEKLKDYHYNEFALGNLKTRMISWLKQGAPETESPKMAETYPSK
jgi:hypothetical protein